MSANTKTVQIITDDKGDQWLDVTCGKCGTHGYIEADSWTCRMCAEIDANEFVLHSNLTEELLRRIYPNAHPAAIRAANQKLCTAGFDEAVRLSKTDYLDSGHLQASDRRLRGELDFAISQLPTLSVKIRMAELVAKREASKSPEVRAAEQKAKAEADAAKREADLQKDRERRRAERKQAKAEKEAAKAAAEAAEAEDKKKKAQSAASSKRHRDKKKALKNK